MNFTKAVCITFGVIALHAIAMVLHLYGALPWFDILMHLLGGFAMGCLGIAIWFEAIHEIRFKKRMERHVRWWLVPLFVLGFVAFIGIAWEWYEFILDALFGGPLRQPGLSDTMADFFFDLLGGMIAIVCIYIPYARR